MVKTESQGVVGHSREGYCAPLTHLQRPPEQLFWKGNLQAASWRCRVGIVGTRRASSWGLQIARQLGRFLAQNDVAVVSGLARGVDMWAHIGCLEVQKGPPIAVLGSGLDYCYPAEHQRLFNRIVDSGGVALSEYPPASPPLKFHFPQRNRIIAALSQVLVLVEAPERSGALITVNHALELGHEIMVVPATLGLHQCAGNLELLRSGATPLCNFDDVLATLEQLHRRQRYSQDDGTLGSLESQVLGALQCRREWTVEEVAEKLGIGVASCHTVLTSLELKRKATRLGGRFQSV